MRKDRERREPRRRKTNSVNRQDKLDEEFGANESASTRPTARIAAQQANEIF